MFTGNANESSVDSDFQASFSAPDSALGSRKFTRCFLAGNHFFFFSFPFFFLFFFFVKEESRRTWAFPFCSNDLIH